MLKGRPYLPRGRDAESMNGAGSKNPPARRGDFEVNTMVQAHRSNIYDTLRSMSGQEEAQRTLLSEPRLSPYLDVAEDDPGKAWSLYLWANELAGSLHAQISLVEIAVRNSIERELRVWNASQGGSADWTLQDQAREPLYTLIRGDLNQARSHARRDANARVAGHPRRGVTPTHNDVIAQLMFGTWVKLLTPLSSTEPSTRQQSLWANGLNLAFPGADQQDAGRIKIGHQLDSIRRLRNRVAHHDNILAVKVGRRINEMLSLVHKANPSYPRLVMANSRVGLIAREDPRQQWGSR